MFVDIATKASVIFLQVSSKCFFVFLSLTGQHSDVNPLVDNRTKSLRKTWGVEIGINAQIRLVY